MVFPGLDQAAGTITVPLWAAGIAAAAVLIMASLVFGLMLRDGLGAAVGAMAGIGLVVVAATAAYSFSSGFERTEERRALDQRMLELNATAYGSGSYLSCLDADLSKSMESWCEKVIFRSPETVATAGAYVKARLSLLSDGLDFARRSEVTYEDRLAELRRAIEADRFGFVAQIFSPERDALLSSAVLWFCCTMPPAFVPISTTARLTKYWPATNRIGPNANNLKRQSPRLVPYPRDGNYRPLHQFPP